MTTKNKDRAPKDPEINAIGRIRGWLEPFDVPTRRRILSYVESRIDPDGGAPAGPTTSMVFKIDGDAMTGAMGRLCAAADAASAETIRARAAVEDAGLGGAAPDADGD